MTPWLWMWGIGTLLGVLVVAYEAVVAPPVRDSRDAAAEWLRSIAPAGTPTLAEAAVYARANNLDHPELLARIDASVRLLNLDLTGEA